MTRNEVLEAEVFSLVNLLKGHILNKTKEEEQLQWWPFCP